ncbi:Probable D%2CD-dipeptide transport system permease protein ddpC [uncultured Eubacterium sp.]|nr:Probable D%2CD-dipeptide transport system permease protein ddpC [uncultured Eubacterium sp.]
MKREKKIPKVSLCILSLIILLSVLAGVIAPYGADDMDSTAINLAPGITHIFGTDNMGRDLFTLVLYGGRASIYIGILSACISTAVAVVYGTLSGLAGERTDDVLMRFSELIMSIPSILLVIFLQAMWGQASYTSLSVIIGLTSWMNISKIVRSEVRQIRNSDYVLAAKTMEGGFWYILRRHLLPNFVSSIMFMVVTNIGQAMITESTLSFLGLGLPLTTVSWGSLLSMSQEMLLSNSWWMIVIPGFVLITTLVCVTNIGEYIRKKNNRLYSNL